MANYLRKYRDAVRKSLTTLDVLEGPEPVIGWSRKAEMFKSKKRGGHWINAVDEVLDNLCKQDPCHIVEIMETGWTMSHPIEERLTGDLFDCKAGGHVGGPEGIPETLALGKYRMYETPDAWEFFPLED